MVDFIDIVFDGPPDHPAPRFVEVETPDGHSVNAGEWIKREDGSWVLRIPRVLVSDELRQLVVEADRMCGRLVCPDTLVRGIADSLGIELPPWVEPRVDPRNPFAHAIPAPLPLLTGVDVVTGGLLAIRPGILRTVNLLRANGFSTRDSWDKMPDEEYAALGPDEYGWNETYIHCDVQPEIMVRESHRLRELLQAAGVQLAAFNPTNRVQPGWIECSYSPHHGTGILSVFGVNDALLGGQVP